MRCNQIHHEIRTKPTFREKKKEKEKVIQGAEIFNSSPKHFIPKLLEAGLIPDSDAKTIATFFKDNPAVDLDLLGEYLGANKDFNKEVLYQFIMLFDLEKLRIDEAIKLVLSSFHMPGEAQIIERILEAFSKAYYRSDSIYANQDAVYVLGYSVIMLNTVLHNVNVKVKMSEEEFIRNNRGINDGGNFPSDMLSDIYKSIKDDPIQVLDIVHSVDHEELINPELANSKWGKILKRTEIMGDYSMLNELLLQPAGDHERDMFDILWEAGLLNTLTNALEMASDTRVLDQIKELFMQISKIATYYSMTEHISKIISNLCQVFIRSSESFVLFYSSPRAVGALETAVAATMICKDYLRSSWGSLLNCLLRLHSLQLLPSQLVELDDFLDSEGRILPPGNSEEIEEWKMNFFKTQGRSSSTTSLDEEIHLSHDLESGSIWNSFTKYLGVQEPKKKKEDMMLEMRTELKVKVTGTGIQILFFNTKALGVESFNYLIKTLISRIKDATEEIHTVLCLELFTNAIISNHNRLTEPIWQLVLSHFESLIQTALQKYSWTCERALVNFLRICITHMESHPQLQKSLVNVLDFFSHLDGEILQHYAGRLAAGLFILCNSHSGPVLASSEAWPLLIKILDRLVAIERASETGFEILCFLVQQLPQISNLELKMYEELLELIIAYLRRVDMPNIRIKGGLHLIKSLHDSIQTKLPAEQLVNFWKKILGKIGRLCQESSSALRIKSYSLLQEIILSQTSKDEFQQWPHWKETFDKLLIPLIIDPFKISSDMLKNISKEKSDMLRGEYEHSRQQCVALTCRTLLMILHMFNKKDEFYTLLFRVIGLLAQTIKSKDGAEIHEGNYEQLKNLLFVLKAEEVLTIEQWEQAWQVLGIQELKDEIEPKAVEEDKV
jgi:brefeldin A-resistance guanine nucleotide exchange factor 1